MFNWFKKKKSNSSEGYNFRWYEIGVENPFNKKVLDIRSFTGTMLSTTNDEKIAEMYGKLRQSNGAYLKKEQIQDSLGTASNLKYEHNGEELNGIVFKSDSMECKWDIYAFDNCFYFTRSWTGELVYNANFKITPNSIEINEIQHSKETEPNVALSDVHYLIKTHALNQPIPHIIPIFLKTDMEIASWSYAKFGNRAYYATYENVYDTIVTLKK